MSAFLKNQAVATRLTRNDIDVSVTARKNTEKPSGACARVVKNQQRMDATVPLPRRTGRSPRRGAAAPIVIYAIVFRHNSARRLFLCEPEGARERIRSMYKALMIAAATAATALSAAPASAGGYVSVSIGSGYPGYGYSSYGGYPSYGYSNYGYSNSGYGYPAYGYSYPSYGYSYPSYNYGYSYPSYGYSYPRYSNYGYQRGWQNRGRHNGWRHHHRDRDDD
jgi:hypothetical protein